MYPEKMSALNDDGLPLNLSIVFILFLMPNLIFVLLTSFNAYLLHLSKKHPRFNHSLGKMANFFAKGALDRLIKNMLRHFEEKKRQQEEQISMTRQRAPRMRKFSETSKNSPASTNNSVFEKKYDPNYLLLIPFQIDLLLTVFVYKILTRDVYVETCQSFLTTYVNREKQVICWLKHINKNTSNLSFNISLKRYCENQTITYTNFEHTDVICIEYVFKLINIIDTVTNIFAWHQATVFIVTKCIVFSYWYQQKMRKSSCWSNVSDHHRYIFLFIVICLSVSAYILLFVFIIPIYFTVLERKRIDLTRHLLYACSKFLAAIIVHINLYTLYQWHSHTTQENQLLTITEEKDLESQQARESIPPIGTSENGCPDGKMMAENYSGTASAKYLTPNVST